MPASFPASAFRWCIASDRSTSITPLHEILLLQPVPEHGPRPQPSPVIKLGIDDSYMSVPAFVATGLAYVLDQDTENFKRQRAGIKASRKAGQTLGNYQEARIRRFHMTLDDYLQIAPR